MSEEKLMPCPRDAAIHAVALIEMGREGFPYSRDQEEFYSDAAEVVDAVLAAVTTTTTPAADEVEAVARALACVVAKNGSPGLPEEKISEWVDRHWRSYDENARAAIAALQARSAEPDVIARLTAEAEVHPNTDWALSLNAVIYFLREGRPAEPAGEEPVAGIQYGDPPFDRRFIAKVVENGFDHDSREWGPVGRKWVEAYWDGSAYMVWNGEGRVPQERAEIMAWAELPTERPATPTNPERLVEARMGDCPSSPDGRHQVDTSMESGPNNCFYCEAPMPALSAAPLKDPE